MAERTATIERITKETKINLSLNLDGRGKFDIDTGSELTDTIAKHGLGHEAVSEAVSKVNDDEWVKWGGGPMPMAHDVIVEVILESGRKLSGHADYFLWGSGFVALSCALVSPLVTTLLLAWRKEDRIVRGCHLAAWIWAAGLSLLWLLLSVPAELRASLWGTRLHFALSVVALVLELVVLVIDRKPA